MLKKETLMYPKRILKSENVENSQGLLIEKPAVLTFTDESPCIMHKETDAPSYLLLDLGKEIHGACKIVVPATKASKIVTLRFTFGESVAEALSNIGENGATNDHSPRDFVREIPCASALEFGQTGYRFLRIELLTTDSFINIQTVVGVCKTENRTQIGYIKTDDTLFNEIIQTAIYTCELNLQNGVIWDGIKRDRMVWSGDLNAGLLTASYVFNANDNIKNALTLLKNSAKNDWVNWLPSYSAWWIINLCDYYRLTGDMQFFKDSVPFIYEIISDFDVCIDEKGEIDFSKSKKVTNNPFYFDWQSNETPDAKIGVAMLIIFAMQKLLVVDEKFACEQVERIITRLNRYKFSTTKYKQICAMQSILGRKQGVKEFLEKNGAEGFSMFASYILFTALEKCGSEKVVDLAKEYYGGMLSRGATTFWEDFDVEWLQDSGRIDEETPKGLKDIHADFGRYCYKGLRHSLCHCWACGIVAFAFEKIVGLEILSPGYEKIKIKPNLLGLNDLEAKIATPKGEIFVRAKNGKFDVTIPDAIEIVK